MAREIRQSHRDHNEIIKQILQIVHSKVEGCNSFELADRCELTWPQFASYRDILISRKLLVPSNTEPTRYYETTKKRMLSAGLSRDRRRFAC